MNMHFKDDQGNHRIVAGDIDFIQDQKGVKNMIKALEIEVKGPVLGVIRWGKFKVPEWWKR